MQSFSVAVTSIYLDKVYSALWVGTSAGHVVVYSESSRDVLTILHRHSGPIQSFFILSGIKCSSQHIHFIMLFRTGIDAETQR